MKKTVIILGIAVLIASGCGQAKKKRAETTSNEVVVVVEDKELDIENDISEYSTNKYSNLSEIDFNNIPQILKKIPLSWERFGVDSGDTVTYDFCYAYNPQFILSKDYKTIRIIIGNELDNIFKIANIYYNDSIFYFKFKELDYGLEGCTFKLIDKNKMIGKLYIYDNYEPFEYLPSEKLVNKRIIKEECDEDE